MIRALPHILSRIFGPPLLIAPVPLDALLAGLTAAMFNRGSLYEGGAPQLPEIGAFDDEPSQRGSRAPYRIDRDVATIPVHGVLVRRAGQVTPDSTELQSYENLT